MANLVPVSYVLKSLLITESVDEDCNGMNIPFQMLAAWAAHKKATNKILALFRKSNQINFIGIKSSHSTVTSHMYTVTQE